MDDRSTPAVPSDPGSRDDAPRSVRSRRTWGVLALLIALLAVGALFVRFVHSDDAWNAHGGTAIRYRLEIQGDLPAGKTAADATRVTAGMISARLHNEGFRLVIVEPLDGLTIEVRVPTGTDADGVRRAVARISRAGTGSIEFRIVVEPSYPPFRGESREKRNREHVWEGAQGGTPVETFDATSEGFDAFKKQEVARLADARGRGEKYVPLDSRYRVVPVDRGQEANPISDPNEFLVVEEPADPTERFGGAIFANTRVSVDREGLVSALCPIKVVYQHAFHAWTAKNVGLPVAEILNGTCVSRPVLLSPLEDAMDVSQDSSIPVEVAERSRMLERQWESMRTLEPPLPARPVEESATTFGADGKPSSSTTSGPH